MHIFINMHTDIYIYTQTYKYIHVAPTNVFSITMCSAAGCDLNMCDIESVKLRFCNQSHISTSNHYLQCEFCVNVETKDNKHYKGGGQGGEKASKQKRTIRTLV